MYRLLPVSLMCFASLTACTTNSTSCEEIENIIAQRHECDELERRIRQSESIVVRSNLEEVYEKQCVEIRFYRDSFNDDQVCSKKQTTAATNAAEDNLKDTKEAEATPF
ncbi:hypothetical protein [Echinimonas agarilytica]|uniref:Lipoprotein n=1 Tax=Echinimonas agarilytica TaxID=1215918 RepID=A0AA41W8D8_9GAMM|nr:hypothetical protein [Echinimonas agarilytica]MCM2680854.1 hypothetical protein [Echinimonas agarilytica]